MADGLDLSLPDDQEPRTRPAGSSRGLWVVLAFQVALGVLFLWTHRRPEATGGAGSPELDLDAQRKLALKLEKQGLADEAAEAWVDYLRVRQADPAKRAEIWYRIGNIRKEAGQYDRALAAYYRSESLDPLPHLEDNIGRQVQECLEALGKFAALRYELAGRTTLDPHADRSGEHTVAEIGLTKITEADLDRMVEEMIGQQLAQYRSLMTPEQLKQRQAELLKELSDNRARRQLLAQYLSEEVLYRQARENGIADQPQVRKRLRQTERSMLAREVLNQELTDRLTLTPGDVKTFYDANPELFMTPEKARVAHMLLADEARARAAIDSIGDGQDFAQLAGTLSNDQTTAATGGVIDEPIAPGQNQLPGTGRVPGLSDAVFSASAGTVLSEPLRSDRGWHVIKVLERFPAEHIPFEQAKEQAYRQLRSRKEHEAREAFLQSLFEKFDVVIHHGKLGGTQLPSGASVPANP